MTSLLDPHSTVLPAVISTWTWLRRCPKLDVIILPAFSGHAALTWIALLVGMLGLGGIGIWAEELYPMRWLAPLMLILGLQQVLIGKTLLSPLQKGGWRPLLPPAFAELGCGLLSEFWNYGSLAKWHIQHCVCATVSSVRNATSGLREISSVWGGVRHCCGSRFAIRRASSLVVCPWRFTNSPCTAPRTVG